MSLVERIVFQLLTTSLSSSKTQRPVPVLGSLYPKENSSNQTIHVSRREVLITKDEIHQFSVALTVFICSSSLGNCSVFPCVMPVVFLLPLKANFKRMWCFCQMAFSGKPGELAEVDLVGNDPEESIMEADIQVSDDLFDDHSVTDISDTNEPGEMQNATGKSSLCPKLFAKACVYRLLFA